MDHHSTRRALVIGSQTYSLAGVHADLDAITPRLIARGFTIDRRTGSAATRAGILDGFEQLIAASEPGDVALVHYSGHGARFVHPSVPRRVQALVPTDWSEGEFRGILDVELSLLLARLTAKTRNVALVLDCCHSGRMGRRLGARRARTLGRDEFGDAQFAGLVLPDVGQLDAEANPHAIKLVAAEVDGLAYEEPVELDGQLRSMGLMSAALCQVLDELAAQRVTWRSLALLVRERVMKLEPSQRPELEGPGQRYLFELAAARRGGGVAYFEQGGRPSLRIGAALGATLGQRFRIMAPGVDDPQAEPLAHATVIALADASAQVELEPAEVSIPSGCLAFGAGPLHRRLSVALGDTPSCAPLRRAIEQSASLRCVDAGATAELSVEVRAGELVLVRGDDLLSVDVPADARGCTMMLERLEQWAHAEQLRNLEDSGLDDAHTLAWGRVVAGRRVPLGPGDTLHVGDAIYVELRSAARRALFFSVISIGVEGSVAVLNRSEPTGIRVEPGEAYALGLELGCAGLELTWPDEVPRGAPLRESLLVVVASQRHDFTSWERDLAGSRGFVMRRVEPVQGFALHRLDFVTNPWPRDH